MKVLGQSSSGFANSAQQTLYTRNLEYAKNYLSLCPEGERKINKELDESLLRLIHNIEIGDKAFLNLKVEDPFFNRTTDIGDVL